LYVLRESDARVASASSSPLHVRADEIRLVSRKSPDGAARPSGITTLDHFFGPDVEAYDAVELRLQSMFVPLRTPTNTSSSGNASSSDAAIEFGFEAFSADVVCTHPVRRLMLATAQGTSVVRQTAAVTPLWMVDDKDNAPHWLEAEATTQRVGAAQNESAKEERRAKRRGKAVAVPFGPRFLGPKRFNTAMVIDVPQVSQAQRDSIRTDGSWTSDGLTVLAVACRLRGCVRGGHARSAHGGRGGCRPRAFVQTSDPECSEPR